MPLSNLLNTYWCNRQTHLIIYWSLLSGCLHKFIGTRCFGLSLTIVRSLLKLTYRMSSQVHWDNVFRSFFDHRQVLIEAYLQNVFTSSLGQGVSVFLWPSSGPYWSLLIGCLHKFIGTTCFGLSLTIIKSLLKLTYRMSSQVHWDNVFRSFFDHRQVLIEAYLQDVFTSSLGQPVSVFLWPSSVPYWSLLTGFLHKFIGTRCFGLSLTIVRSLLKLTYRMSSQVHWDKVFRSLTIVRSLLKLTYRMSSQVHWDNVFRSFFDHHQVLKDLWKHPASKLQYIISCVWRLYQQISFSQHNGMESINYGICCFVLEQKHFKPSYQVVFSVI